MKILKSILLTGLLALGISQAKAQTFTNFGAVAGAAQLASNATITLTNPPSITIKKGRDATMWVTFSTFGVVTNGCQFSLKGFDANGLAATSNLTNVTSVANGTNIIRQSFLLPAATFGGYSFVAPNQIITPNLTNGTLLTEWSLQFDQ